MLEFTVCDARNVSPRIKDQSQFPFFEREILRSYSMTRAALPNIYSVDHAEVYINNQLT